MKEKIFLGDLTSACFRGISIIDIYNSYFLYAVSYILFSDFEKGNSRVIGMRKVTDPL